MVGDNVVVGGRVEEDRQARTLEFRGRGGGLICIKVCVGIQLQKCALTAIQAKAARAQD